MVKLTFTLHDVQEISASAYVAFISTFRYQSEESDFDSSESDLSNFDPDVFECGQLTPEVENMVENSWEICNPLEQVYGPTTSELIKETVQTATEETQCVRLKFFKDLTPGEDRRLIETCTEISF
jgi:hypothetical protein